MSPTGMTDTSRGLDVAAAPSFCGDAAAVAVLGSDLFVFNRGPQRVSVFAADGRYVRGWGSAETYVRPHGLTVAADGNLFLVDAGSHVVDKVTPDGELLMRIGTLGVAAVPYSGEPFNQPTDLAEHPLTGELFISDGYANSRIHRYSADGRHIASWGSPGTGPHNLSNPHGLCLVDDDHLAVCDRENYRIQFFTLDGELVDSWHWHHPSSIRRGVDGLLYIAELGPPPYQHGLIPDMGCRISIVDLDGTRRGHLGASLPGLGDGQLLAPHGIAVSPDREVYVAEVNRVYLEVLGRDPAQTDLHCLRRWSPQ